MVHIALTRLPREIQTPQNDREPCLVRNLLDSTAMQLELEISPDDQRTFGPCDCCGNMTQRVWGYVRDNGIPIAAYFVEWTPGHADNPANFDIILGTWGEGTTASDRKAVALGFLRFDIGPAFSVIDATKRPVARNTLVGEALTREQVIGQPIAELVFAVCDAIWLKDDRIAPLHTLFNENPM